MKKIMAIQQKITRLRADAIVSRHNIYNIHEKLTFEDGSGLPSEAEGWADKIKFVCLKNFKVVWQKGVKGAGDVVDTDEIQQERMGKLKYYFNRPVFSVTDNDMIYLKKNFEQFKDGFLTFIQYLMEQVENIKKKDDKKYTLDRTIFLITTAKNKEEIDFSKNTIAINTEGTENINYKSTPTFITPDDLKKFKEYNKQPYNIPTTPPQGGGGPPGM